MSILGTDISSYQSATPTLTGDAFTGVKATEGVGYRNPNWASQVDTARAQGDGVMHYHFANGHNTPESEAQYFWSVVSSKWQAGEPLSGDFEGSFFTTVTDPVAWALAFYTELKRLTGLIGVHYLDWSHVHDPRWNWQPLVDFGCGLWGSAYNGTGFGDPSPWPFVAFWQNADTNVSGGDSDVFYGDLVQFRAYGGQAPTVAADPVTAPPTPAPDPAPVSAPAPSPTHPAIAGTCVVEAGDTLSGIGAQVGVSWQAIAAVNPGINPDVIQIGQTLNLPWGANLAALHPLGGAPAPAPNRVCTVEAGDTLSSIAGQFGTDWQTLARINNLDNPDLIYPGQVLNLP